MGACSSKDSQQSVETTVPVTAGETLKVTIVGVRGHLCGAAPEGSGEKQEKQEGAPEEQKEEAGEEQEGEQEGDDPKGRFCVVKAEGKEGELFRTKAVEGICESVWKEEAELEHAKGDTLDFSVWDGSTLLGVAKLEASAFESEGFNGELKVEETGEGAEVYLRLKIAVDGNEYPSGLTPEFSISVTKEKGSLSSMDVDSTDGVTVRVKSVDGGCFQEYNESAEDKDKLRPGDFIVKANKAKGDSGKILKELKSATALELMVSRPEEFSVAFERNDTRKPLGLEFSKKLEGHELIVAKVAKGPAQEWNSSHADRQLCKGDRVVAVGAKRLAAAELQKEVNSQKEVKLTVVRPANPDSWQFC